MRYCYIKYSHLFQPLASKKTIKSFTFLFMAKITKILLLFFLVNIFLLDIYFAFCVSHFAK